jgi:hypothetical protein
MSKDIHEKTSSFSLLGKNKRVKSTEVLPILLA